MDSLVIADNKKGAITVASGDTTRNRHMFSNKHIQVVPGGIRLNAWRKNPVVLWQHNQNIPIGTAQLSIVDGKLVADSISFHRKSVPVLSETGSSESFDTSIIAELWDEGFLNATSLHVIFSPEDEARAFEANDRFVIPSSELIEFSIVTIPADRDAIRERMAAKGVPDALFQCLCAPTPNMEEDDMTD